MDIVIPYTFIKRQPKLHYKKVDNNSLL